MGKHVYDNNNYMKIPRIIVEHYKQCPYEENLKRVLDENSLDILIKQTPKKIIPCQFHILHTKTLVNMNLPIWYLQKKEKKKKRKLNVDWKSKVLKILPREKDNGTFLPKKKPLNVNYSISIMQVAPKSMRSLGF